MLPGACSTSVLSVAVTVQAAGSVVPVFQIFAFRVVGLVPMTWSLICRVSPTAYFSPVTVLLARVVRVPLMTFVASRVTCPVEDTQALARYPPVPAFLPITYAYVPPPLAILSHRT